MRFEIATPHRILFGRGTASEIAPAAASMGRRALLVTGRRPGRWAGLSRQLEEGAVEVVTFPVAGEPTVRMAREATALARARSCDLVVAIGGGSAIDLGKAVAGLLASGGDPLDHLEVVGQGRAFDRPSAPFIAVPTTAGTGSEVTRNAVLAVPEHGIKASLRSPYLLPRLAVVDPDLTVEVPPDVTAATGMDALTQLVEPFTGARAQPFTDALCRDGIARSVRSLRDAFHDGSNRAAREDLCLASLFGGMALANAGLGAVHGFAAAIGGRASAPHGAICARLLGPVMAVNLRALRQRQPDSPSLAKYTEVARLLTDDRGAQAADGPAWVETLRLELGIPGLSIWGIGEADVADIVHAAAAASSTKGNPVVLTTEELAEALVQALP